MLSPLTAGTAATLREPHTEAARDVPQSIRRRAHTPADRASVPRPEAAALAGQVARTRDARVQGRDHRQVLDGRGRGLGPPRAEEGRRTGEEPPPARAGLDARR